MGPSPNQGGLIGPVRLGVVHVMEGTLAGTDSWFMNPSAQVSAHFGVGKNGAVHQYVDTSLIAWAEANYNSVAISVEHEGNSGESLTPQQIAADQPLAQWLKKTSGIPLVMSTYAGWCGHGQLGVEGGNHPDCPGQPILNQWPEVLNVAPPAPPTPKVRQNMQCTDPTTGGVWCLRQDGSIWAYPVNGGATPPWLGALNTSVGKGVNVANISGISLNQAAVGYGYTIGVDNGPQGFALYAFGRDGKFAHL